MPGGLSGGYATTPTVCRRKRERTARTYVCFRSDFETPDL